MFAAVVTGLSSGAVHAVTGPDHLLGLGPLALERKKRAWRVGLAWGVGHSAGTALVVGTALAFFGTAGVAPLAMLSSVGDRVGGAALLAMGLFALVKSLREGVRGLALHEQVTPPATWSSSVALDFVHGASGGAAVALLVPGMFSAASQASWAPSVAWLAAFAIGSSLAMAALTAALARWTSTRRATLPLLAKVRTGGAAASVVVGLAWMTL
jgi:hypothetical protein